MTKQSGYLIKMKAFLPSHVIAHEKLAAMRKALHGLGIEILTRDEDLSEFKPYGITRSAPPDADAAAGDGAVHPSAVPAAAEAGPNKPDEDGLLYDDRRKAR